jgi:Icc-related predicted phosphoesterase
MKLLCFSDLHGDSGWLSSILQDAGPVDLVLLAGDITHFGTPNIAESLVRQATRDGGPVLAVAGNCDSPEIDLRLTSLQVSLFGRGTVVNGVGFYGLSAMPPWTGHMYELTEEEIAATLEQGAAEVSAERQVIVSHPPPHGTQVDRTRKGQHVGSRSLRDWIERTSPTLVVCGHIHEARGIDRIGPTKIVNCGPAFQGCYAIVELDETVQVELRTAPE